MKSFKLKDDNYFDSSSIMHNRKLLKDILNDCEVLSDENRMAVKFDNGLLICAQKKQFDNIAINTSWGGIYASATLTGDNYLVPFKSIFSVQVTNNIIGLGNSFHMLVGNANTLTVPPQIQLLRGSSGTVTTIVYYLIIGLWK